MQTDRNDVDGVAAGAPDAAVDVVPARTSRPIWKVALLGLAGLVLLLLVTGWFSRERIADNLISDQLEQLGIPATYKIESIGPQEQIVSNLVIGDPDRPDLTAERVIVSLSPQLGIPGLGSIRLVRPRLYGTLRDGKLSFGSLDPLIYTDSEEPFSLPDLTLGVEDGRALIESEHGAIGIKLAGEGHLRDGFEGELAASAPRLTYNDCTLQGATLYGTIAVMRRRPRIAGPVRTGQARCSGSALSLARAGAQIELVADEDLAGLEAHVSLSTGAVVAPGYRIASSGGTIHTVWKNGRMTAKYDLEAKRITTPQILAPRMAIDGTVRSLDGFARIDADGEIEGKLGGLGAQSLAALQSLIRSGQGTLVEDLTSGIRQSIRREARGASVRGRFIARRSDGAASLVVPNAVLQSARGAALLSVSRFQIGLGDGVPRIHGGNFATGGNRLPRISGRVRDGQAGRTVVDLRMAPFRSGTANVAVPRLVLMQSRGGELGFAGEARVSGKLPGGEVAGLVVPVDGNWSRRKGLALWRKCVPLRFERLQMAQLELAGSDPRVCPSRSGAIVRSGAGGLRIAGGLTSLNLSGRLGETPLAIKSEAAGFAWPGNIDARGIEVLLGSGAEQSTFRIAQLRGALGKELAGTFAGADVLLDAVPLDLFDIAGDWRFADRQLTLGNGSFRLEDRDRVDRFEPVVARDATLTLDDNAIVANAIVREPASDRQVLRAVVRHDLGSGRGDADLAVDGIVFDDKLQPDTLSHLALGVIANAQGVVRGVGRIEWDENEVRSTGRFGTDKLDFAAAFGPVTGAAGTIEFTDLLGLVTAPQQTLAVQAINPGVEVNDGVVTYSLKPDNLLAVAGASWPFMGGTLRLEPVTMEIGSDQPTRYVLVIDALDAALFMQRMELDNLSATGVFDGKLPVVFDKDGGRIEGGYLLSRAPGGNVSYVGELTYKDLSTMANFAFDALRSLDYRQMRIDLEGSLEGEIVTRVAFEGISQGEGATSNFLTRRIARLPIRFRVNVRAPFMQLITSVRSIYDPEYIRDPRTFGLLDEGGVPRQPGPAMPASPAMPTTRPADPAIQPSESDAMP